jgi:cyclopropane fatty-acyl-phospholipid synthase-like methyltransferase
MVSTEIRAKLSAGSSDDAIYKMVVKALDLNTPKTDVIVDVGCGQGNLYSYVKEKCDRYIGVDEVKYQQFSESSELRSLI